MQAQLRSVLSHKGGTVHAITPSATVLEATRLMDVQHIGALLVMEGTRPVGIFTERDVLRRVVARRLDPNKTPVSEVMTRDLVAVRPTLTVEEAMAIVTERRIRHLPVMEMGRVIGMVSAGDLTRWVIRDYKGEIQQLVEFITGKYPG